MTKDRFGLKIARDILIISIGISGTLSIFNWNYLENRFKETFFRKDLEQSIQENKRFLEDKYMFRVEMGPLRNWEIKDSISGKELSLAEKNNLLIEMREELSKYPPDYVNLWCNPLEVRLLSEIVMGGLDVSGFQKEKEIYIGRTKGTLLFYLDSRSTIHHEFFHAADKAYIENEDWNKLNKDGKNSYLRNYYDSLSAAVYLANRPKGFSNVYGLKNEFEDRATIVDDLMIEPEALEEIAQGDSVLNKKIRKIKDYFLKFSNGKMNKKYWDDLKEERVDEKYWDEN